MKHKILSSILSALLISSSFCSANVCISANAETYITGDINEDSIVDAKDASLVLSYYAVTSVGGNGRFSDEQKLAADVNSDSMIDSRDASFILRYYAYSSVGGNLTISEFISGTYETVADNHIDSPQCRSAALFCADTQTMLYADNINEKTAPASITKLLTASVALHYLSPETVVTVGTELSLVHPNSSLCMIRQGHKLKLYDLLTGMLLPSGNDAAYTVAVTTARAVSQNTAMSDADAVQYFCGLMNGFAQNIGMTNSHFASPEGWDSAETYTTAADLLKLAEYAFSVPEIREITGTYQKKVYFVSGENITWTNTNSLINPYSEYYCSDAVGMKTGSTVDAGNCLIAAFINNDRTYFSVVVGCAENTDRYELTRKIHNIIQ